MVLVHEMDRILYEIQRQGLISFYMTSIGEEACDSPTQSRVDLIDIASTTGARKRCTWTT